MPDSSDRESKGNRRKLLGTADGRIVVYGMVNKSIQEPAVPVFLDDGTSHRLQAVELYLPHPERQSTPLMAVDIVANTYSRQTYFDCSGRSGTFGSSLVGAPSFRTSDGVLHYLPEIQKARISLDSQLRVELEGAYGSLARFRTHRTYECVPRERGSRMSATVTFEALQDIRLSVPLWRTDAFRLLSFASMFRDHQCSDADTIQVTDNLNNVHAVLLSHDGQRNAHLFTQRIQGVRRLILHNSGVTTGRRGAPGASDCPSFQMTLADQPWIEAVSVQGYLTDSMNRNDDSLSVWIEWIGATQVIEAGKKIEYRYSVSAEPPGVDGSDD